MSWSSGKDSALALHRARQDPELDVVGMLCTVNADADRVAMHAVRRELLLAQGERLGPARSTWSSSRGRARTRSTSG